MNEYVHASMTENPWQEFDDCRNRSTSLPQSNNPATEQHEEKTNENDAQDAETPKPWNELVTEKNENSPNEQE